MQRGPKKAMVTWDVHSNGAGARITYIESKPRSVVGT